MLVTEDMTLFFADNDIFSNWFRSPFVVDGIRFNCAEQWMMYGKAKLFADEASAVKILEARHPREQKALGRQVQGYDDALWNERRLDIVVQGLYAKFSQNQEHRDALLATGQTLVVEASPYDRIWGIGLAEDDPRALDQSKWRGQNLLGQALMKVRQRLMDEQKGSGG